jgi:hypothetical protein
LKVRDAEVDQEELFIIYVSEALRLWKQNVSLCHVVFYEYVVSNYKMGNIKWGRGNRKKMSSEKLRYALGMTV